MKPTTDFVLVRGPRTDDNDNPIAIDVSIQRNNEKFDFFIPITRSALCCKGLKDINRQDLLKGFQDQLLEILVKFSPSNFTNDNGIVPHRFTFAIIDSDYAVYGINCLSAINKAHGIKVKVNEN